MEEPASTEASITFCPFLADRRPAEGFDMVGLQRFAFVFPRAAREHTSVPCSFGHPVRARPSSVCIHACLSICNDLGLFSPRAARNRQDFGELPPKNARVRLGMRALLVILGRKRFQRAESCSFMLYYQDIFAIAKHSNAQPGALNTHSRDYWQQVGSTPSKRRCAREIPRAHLRFDGVVCGPLGQRGGHAS